MSGIIGVALIIGGVLMAAIGFGLTFKTTPVKPPAISATAVTSTVPITVPRMTVNMEPDTEQKRIYNFSFSWGYIKIKFKTGYTGRREQDYFVRLQDTENGQLLLGAEQLPNSLVNPTILADVHHALIEARTKDLEEFSK